MGHHSNKGERWDFSHHSDSATRTAPAAATGVSPMAEPGRAPRLLEREEGGGGDGGEGAAAATRTATPAAEAPPEPLPYPWVLRALGQRRTWVALFLLAYAVLLSASWRLLLSVRVWYSAAVAAPSAAPWPALYASVLCGGIFGLLSMGAALAVALPAMVTTWITVLVLLTFAGKPRWVLMREGRRATADIAGIALRVLVREGNLVAAICAVVSFAALLLYREDPATAAAAASR